MGNKDGKKKQAKVKNAPAESKTARVGENPGSTNHKQPAWIIGILDVDGPWGRTKVESVDDFVTKILKKLKNADSKTWAQIRSEPGNNDIPVEKLIKDARDRLKELKLQDLDAIFHFRFSGKERLWGIRDQHHFKILWWDPEHEICPSKLKHT
jgi:hypothetical protein